MPWPGKEPRPPGRALNWWGCWHRRGVVWTVLPAGEATEEAVQELGWAAGAGRRAGRRGQLLLSRFDASGGVAFQRGVHFVDAGTSGGIWGRENGYSMSIGGAPEAVEIVRPLIETLLLVRPQAGDTSGPAARGISPKMVHNGIEYGLMQAYAEGFALLRSKDEFALEIDQVAELWREGSVIRSWLLDLAALGSRSRSQSQRDRSRRLRFW